MNQNNHSFFKNNCMTLILISCSKGQKKHKWVLGPCQYWLTVSQKCCDSVTPSMQLGAGHGAYYQNHYVTCLGNHHQLSSSKEERFLQGKTIASHGSCKKPSRKHILK
uniref:Uncharacterized protein n=1 Tax=Anguilla anguilla TaxID=7936 RepID=A0A0E9X532_ANGAN